MRINLMSFRSHHSVADCERLAAHGFHQDRMKATSLKEALTPLHAQISIATSEPELRAASQLRAKSFYVYPPEREFSGLLHQRMKVDEEFERLLHLDRNSRCLIACSAENTNADGLLLPTYVCRAGCPPNVANRKLPRADGSRLIGTLDVTLAPSLPGEVIIARCANVAYMHNVCTDPAVRRRGVGKCLVQAAIEHARKLGAKALYVHLMAVNEIGMRLYESCGFQLEQKESSNQAHCRGHCLDGIEGRGRTVLMRTSV